MPLVSVRAEEWSAAAVTVGDTTVTPRSRAVVVRWPTGALVWHRPTVVLVARAGQMTRVPIVDVVGIAQVAAVTLAIAAAIATVLSARRKEESP